jgi:hypothetical protein
MSTRQRSSSLVAGLEMLAALKRVAGVTMSGEVWNGVGKASVGGNIGLKVVAPESLGRGRVPSPRYRAALKIASS